MIVLLNRGLLACYIKQFDVINDYLVYIFEKYSRVRGEANLTSYEYAICGGTSIETQLRLKVQGNVFFSLF